METFSALLAICAGNLPVSGEFLAQRPVTRSFNVFLDLRLNKRWVNNREAGELRRHRTHNGVIVMISEVIFKNMEIDHFLANHDQTQKATNHFIGA